MQWEKTRSQAIEIVFLAALAGLSLLFLASTASASASSVVHGDVYQWSSFDTMKNVEVVVNSVPVQKMVSIDGSYSFNLTKGSYAIIAVSGANTSDALYARENVTIDQDGGDYVIDLVMFPSTGVGDLSTFDENYTAVPPDEPGDSQGSALMLVAGVVAIVIIAIAAGAFLWLRRKKSAAPISKHDEPIAGAETPKAPPEEVFVQQPDVVEPAPPSPAKQSASDSYTLPEDLKEVIRIMEKHGGRMTQLDLRKSLPYSEAKVSLMISDLESRGIVKKIKKGRGNILILSTQDSSG